MTRPGRADGVRRILSETRRQAPLVGHTGLMTSSSYEDMDTSDLVAMDPEGDSGRRLLLNPSIFRMLGDVTGRRVLDAGAGQGYLSRLLAGLGAQVTALEPSTRLLGHAAALEREMRQGIALVQKPLHESEFRAEFDYVVCNMVLLDIGDWRPALDACIVALRPGGQLVISLEHPCWSVTAGQTWRASRRVEISEYAHEFSVDRRFGRNYYRPLSHYLNHALTAGCVLVELAEPTLPLGSASGSGGDILEHITNFVVAHFVRSS